jgi:ankyrin repeat protein
LAKIEFIVKNQLSYDPNHQDAYLNQSPPDLFKVLGQLSSHIHRRYEEKKSQLNWFTKILSKEKEVSAANMRIQNYVSPPRVFPMPNELIQKMTKYLGVSDIGVLAQLNRHGKTHAETAMVREAKKLGYEGGGHAKASKYMSDLFREISESPEQGVIPEKYFSYKRRTFFFPPKIDPERVLQNLQTLSAEEMVTMLSNLDLYSQSFPKIRRIFNPKRIGKVTQADRGTIQQKGSKALALSAENGDKNISDLLLQYGADPNIPAWDGNCPLHFAAREGHTDIVELLLKHGARINERGNGGATALAFALVFASRPKVKVVELLLRHGADPNILTERGYSPLHFAASVGCTDSVALLLEHGARVNDLGEGVTALAYACDYDEDLLWPSCPDYPKVVELLLQHGADPNILTWDGNSPLYFAVRQGHEDIVKFLLKSGADPNIPTWEED